MSEFRLERYALQLRAETSSEDAPIPEDALEALASTRLLVSGKGAGWFLRRIAYLWCGALLDTRCNTLLLPVMAQVREMDTALAELLGRRNRECGWGLEEEFFTERLESGACLVLLEGLEDGPRRVRGALESYPRCRYLVASGADDGDAGSGEDRFDFGGPQASRVVIHRQGV